MYSGNGQKIWLSGEQVDTLTKCEAKMSIDYEEIEMCGSDKTEYEYTGFKITGTLSRKKKNSNLLNKIQSYKKNYKKMPAFTITGANMQVDGQTERVNLLKVYVTEAALINAEAKKLTDEEIPFVAVDWELVDKVV